jgi:hypothetical protein
MRRRKEHGVHGDGGELRDGARREGRADSRDEGAERRLRAYGGT